MKLFKCLPVGFLRTNCYILGSPELKKAWVIDPGGDCDLISEQLKKMGVEVKAILVTHGHPDHWGAVKELAAITGAPIHLHPDDAKFYHLTADQPLLNGDLLALGDHTLEVIHTPGHSPGSVCLKSSNRQLFSGDTLFCGSVGRTDFPGGDIEALRQSLEKIKLLPAYLTVYPGHGEETTLEEEFATNPYLTQEEWEV